MQRSNIRFAILLAGLAAACSDDDSSTDSAPTLGDHGRVEFAYREWFSTFSMDHGLLVGATMSIDVSGPGNQSGVAVASSDPAIATFSVRRGCSCDSETANSASSRTIDESEACQASEQKKCTNFVYATAIAPGTTRLELRDANQAIIDSVAVTVGTATSGYIEGSRPGSDEKPKRLDAITMRVGEQISFSGRFTDAGGKRMVGEPSSYATDAPAVAVAGIFFMPSLTAVSAGTTTLRLAIPDIDLQIPVTVTP
jgi:hypothetical protein